MTLRNTRYSNRKPPPGRLCRIVAVAALLPALLSGPLGAEMLRGRVLSGSRLAVEHARVGLASGEVEVFTDPDGFFELGPVELPLTVVVEHPRFDLYTRDVAVVATDLEIVLKAKQAVYETIAVSANRGEQNFAPVSVASSVIEPGETASPAGTVGQLLGETSAVSENGQGGTFQTWSIRGVSRQRVLTLVSGVRIVGERRAGVSASFIDPHLLGSAEVVRGPSSTYYGSGALGGVVQLFPRRFRALTFASGFESQGEGMQALVAGGDETSSWGLAFREADSSETPSGAELNDRFRLASGIYRRAWERAGLGIDLTVLGSEASDVGKSNTDYPQRATSYPLERHLIARLEVQRPAVWEFQAALHPNSLTTRVEQAGAPTSRLENDALDVNLGWQRRLTGSSARNLRFGLDYFGRRSVDAVEWLFDPSGGDALFVQRTLDGGREDEVGLFGAWEWNRGPAAVVAGGRLVWQRQENRGAASVEDEELTTFVGVVLPVGAGVELVANAGTGLRFPSPSERFFTGVTGRGYVEGNPGLDPEASLNIDAGARFFGEKLFLAAYLFRNEIDDYIERVELEPERLTFFNLSSGRIEGVEAEGLLSLTPALSLSFGGHALEGRDDGGNPLADVPADRVHLGLAAQRGDWSSRLRWESRRRKDDPGSGEKDVPAADLVSAGISYTLRAGLAVQVGVRNALDEQYFSSADRKVPLAPGRSVSVGFRWTRANN